MAGCQEGCDLLRWVCTVTIQVHAMHALEMNAHTKMELAADCTQVFVAGRLHAFSWTVVRPMHGLSKTGVTRNAHEWELFADSSTRVPVYTWARTSFGWLQAERSRPLNFVAPLTHSRGQHMYAVDEGTYASN